MTAALGNAFDTRAEAPFSDYLRLLKPRVMSLAVFTAAVGLVAAPVPVHPVIAFASILCIAVGAGAAGALNMWWDADIDRQMSRTRNRPVAAGRVAPETARDLGVALALLSVLLLSLFANLVAGALLALAIFHYVVVYSMWLKRNSVHNVVIGGVAGALPPVIGWSAAAGGFGLEPLLMFAVIFLWTPPHSWALALIRRAEYAQVGVPTLPVRAGVEATRRQILLYTLALIPVGAALAFTPVGGGFSLIASVVLGGGILYRTIMAIVAGAGRREEGRLFGFSIAYLFGLFAAILIDSSIRAL